MARTPLSKYARVFIRRILRLGIKPKCVGTDLDIEVRPFHCPTLTVSQCGTGKSLCLTQWSQPGRLLEQRLEIDCEDAAVNKS